MAEERAPFAPGFVFKRNENAPDWVVGRLALKVEEVIPFLEENDKNGWVSVNIKISQAGKFYCELDTFEPNSQGAPAVNAAAKPAAPAARRAAPAANTPVARRAAAPPVVEKDENGDDLPF